MAREDGHTRTRKVLMMAVLFWVAAVVALFIGMRTRVKPVMVVGLISGVVALGVTQLWLRGGPAQRQ